MLPEYDISRAVNEALRALADSEGFPQRDADVMRRLPESPIGGRESHADIGRESEVETVVDWFAGLHSLEVYRRRRVTANRRSRAAP